MLRHIHSAQNILNGITWKGTDHAASLEPDGIRKLARNLYAVYESLTYKSEDILPIEQVQRDKLKYRKN